MSKITGWRGQEDERAGRAPRQLPLISPSLPRSTPKWRARVGIEGGRRVFERGHRLELLDKGGW
jgi:hypothetical protein